jgi:DNA-binding NarL/FixJ family response regulator
MEPVYVIIADRSQLVRIGLTGLLNQMGYLLSIREISNTDNLNIALQKDHKSLLIISRSLLDACPANIMRYIISKPRQFMLVLINDNNSGSKPLLSFDEVIETTDMEKVICRKLEKYVQLLAASTHHPKSSETISEREKEVLKLVANGMTNKEIAERLFISSHTVITHRKNITSKLGIKTIAGLTVYAIINKLIAAEEIK